MNLGKKRPIWAKSVRSGQKCIMLGAWQGALPGVLAVWASGVRVCAGWCTGADGHWHWQATALPDALQGAQAGARTVLACICERVCSRVCWHGLVCWNAGMSAGLLVHVGLISNQHK